MSFPNKKLLVSFLARTGVQKCIKKYHKINASNKTFLQVGPCTTHCRRAHNAKVKDYYKVLGVKNTAELKEIKEAFYELSKQYHPDVNQEEGTLTKFREVAEAYDVLSNPIERKAHDKALGLVDNKRKSPLKQQGRRFNGIHGEFINGEFVDNEKVVQRTIHYDLSPERMAKVWERYKTRWNRPEEIERRKNLQKRKEQFRQDIDKKRAQMYNMSEAEREDFMHKMRMFRPDAANINPNLKEFDKKSHSWTDTYEKEEKSKAKAKEREQATKDREERDRQFKEEVNAWEEEMKAFNFKQETAREAKYHKYKTEEDPFMQGQMPTSSGEATDWRSYLNIGLERSTERLKEIGEAQPFSYTQSSVKYGIYRVDTIKFSKVFVSVICIIICFFSLAECSNYYDETDDKLVKKKGL